MIHASHAAPVSTVTTRRSGKRSSAPPAASVRMHHRAVELRAEEVVDDRAAGPAHDARLVAGAGVEREREPELLGHGPEPVVLGVVVGPRRHPRGEEQRPAPACRRGAAPRRSPRRCRASAPAPTASSRCVAEHVGGPVVVRAAQLQLEPGVVGREARLQRERREDHLGGDAVALLVADAVVGVEVADDRDLALGRPSSASAGRGPRRSACASRRRSRCAGTRSRYAASTRSSYSSIGSVTCESVEMKIASAVRHATSLRGSGGEDQTAAARRHEHVLGAVDLVGRGAAHLAHALEDVVHPVDVAPRPSRPPLVFTGILPPSSMLPSAMKSRGLAAAAEAERLELEEHDRA